MSEHFDFTVVVPCFNKKEYVAAALHSILSQDNVVVQIVFMDGGSSDGSVEVAQKTLLQSEESQRRRKVGWEFSITSEKDRGQSHAINKGLLSARGRYLCWLNADDCYYPGALSSAKRYFESNPGIGLVYGDLDCIDEKGDVIKRRPSREWNRRHLLNSYCYIPQPATFWRSELTSIVGLLDVKLHFAMDYDYWLRMSEHTSVQRIPILFAAIRIMSGTKTGLSPLNAMPEALRVGRRHGSRYLSNFRVAYWLWRIGLQGVVRVVAKRISW